MTRLAAPFSPFLDDPASARALADAKTRLDEYHASVRYQYCEDLLSPDIYDPTDVSVEGAYRPDPLTFQAGAVVLPNDPLHKGRHAQPAMGVPYHSNYFDYDPTDPPPPWSPRRPDWKMILVDRVDDTAIPAGFTEQSFPEEKRQERQLVVQALNQPDVVLSDQLRAFATTEVPYGLWQVKPECQQKLATQSRVSSFVGDARPAWMDNPKANASPDAPVYKMSPGAALYRHICFNCHGPKADGKGLQGDLLAAASNGEARPANFRDGLFGLDDKMQPNLLTFDVGQTGDVGAAASWGSRYMAWMALGGTLKRIPTDIIHLVEATRILGTKRENLDWLPGAADVTGNMLNMAKNLCSAVLPEPHSAIEQAVSSFVGGQVPAGDTYPPFNFERVPLITSNGDKEMWLHLCNDFSPPVVRVYEIVPGKPLPSAVNLTGMYYADGYPADRPVLDHLRKQQMGVHSSHNRYPACVKAPADPAEAQWLAGTELKTKLNMPECPAEFLATAKPLWTNRVTGTAQGDEFKANVALWSLRGAIATGMTVFSYLQSNVHLPPKPYFNECQLLP